MSLKRRVAFAGSTFVIAGAAGYVMQNGDALAERFAGTAEEPAPIAIPVEGYAMAQPTADEANVILGQAMASESVVKVQGAAMLSGDALMSALPKNTALPVRPDHPGGVQVAALSQAPEMPETDAALPEPALQPDCTISMSAVVEAAAMVRLFLDAPCHGDARVTIEHEALSFTAIMSDDGLLDVSVPALATNAAFYAFFGDKEGGLADIQVPDLAQFDRVAILWTGETGLELHAREYGADYGEWGHVWAGAPRAPMFAAKAQGGYMTRLGNAAALEPQMAEIYTFPTMTARNQGAVRLSVEAEITSGNCGRDIEALSLQSNGDGTVSITELDLAVPGCDAVGDFLVLNSLLRDLKVAGN